jgi:hypothetical protein
MTLAVIAALAVMLWSGSWALGFGAGVLGYLISCLIYPSARCLKCHGSPRHFAEGGRVWRNCIVCGGSGRRRRLGTTVLNGVGIGKK